MISGNYDNISREEFKKIANKLHAGMDKDMIVSILEKENIKLRDEQIDTLVTMANSELPEDDLNNVAGGCGGGGNDSKDD